LRKQVEGQSEELKRSAEVASLYKRAFQFTEAASTSARGVLSIVADVGHATNEAIKWKDRAEKVEAENAVLWASKARLLEAEAILRAGKEDSWAAEEQWADGQYLEKTRWVKDAEAWLAARLERSE
jgi:hypothetical protein